MGTAREEAGAPTRTPADAAMPPKRDAVLVKDSLRETWAALSLMENAVVVAGARAARRHSEGRTIVESKMEEGGRRDTYPSRIITHSSKQIWLMINNTS